ncbi:hypothetical protein [Shimazuella kribbensis]|uniref:hypothetical protein n=1 Tax=Shimazuella kribbensis TaxID=139808 RepID=UPI000491F953|nr:hypothetical protein [Shimazuella kribbensis]
MQKKFGPWTAYAAGVITGVIIMSGLGIWNLIQIGLAIALSVYTAKKYRAFEAAKHKTIWRLVISIILLVLGYFSAPFPIGLLVLVVWKTPKAQTGAQQAPQMWVSLNGQSKLYVPGQPVPAGAQLWVQDQNGFRPYMPPTAPPAPATAPTAATAPAQQQQQQPVNVQKTINP